MPRFSRQILPLDDPRSPYHINVPSNASPTDELIKRLTIWRKILKQLVFYLRETSLVKEYNARINTQMLKSVQFPSTAGGNHSFNVNTAAATKVIKLGAKLNGLPSSGKAMAKANTVSLGLTSVMSASSSGAEKGHSRTRSGANMVSNLLNPNGLNALVSEILAETKNNDFWIPETYFNPEGSGGIMDLSTVLNSFHKNLALKEQQTALHLATKVIPRLDNLRKDLVVKIKEIRSIAIKDFDTTRIKTEMAVTGKLVVNFMQSIETFSTTYGMDLAEPPAEAPVVEGRMDEDPYLVKLRLEFQIRRQLMEENYVKESFNSLQAAGEQLDKIIFKEISSALMKYSALLCGETESPTNLLVKDLKNTILGKSASYEWESFLSQNTQHFLVAGQRHSRKLSAIVFPYKEVFLTKCVRSGYLMKKSRLLKNYSTPFYVLTPTYLHEFKISDRKKDPYPSMSLNLSDFIVANLNESLGKFTLNVTATAGSTSTITAASGTTVSVTKMSIVFKCPDTTDLLRWFHDLNNLTLFTSVQKRYEYVESKLLTKNKSFTQSDHILPRTPGIEEPNLFENPARTAELMGRLDHHSHLRNLSVESVGSGATRMLYPMHLPYAESTESLSTPLLPLASPNINLALMGNPFDASFPGPSSSSGSPRSITPVQNVEFSKASLPSLVMIQQEQAIIEYHRQQLEQMQRISQKVHQQQVQPQALARGVVNHPGTHTARTTSSGSVTSAGSEKQGFTFGQGTKPTSPPRPQSPPVAGATNALFLNAKHSLSSASLLSGNPPSQILHVLERSASDEVTPTVPSVTLTPYH